MSTYKWEKSVDNISNLHKKKKIQRRREASEYDADRRRKAPKDLLVFDKQEHKKYSSMMYLFQ